MDTSETNIKMCEKATEIQGRQPQIGDLWVFQGETDLEDIVVCLGQEWQEPLLRPWCNYASDEVEYNILIKKSTWLPRQEQLQEMLGDVSVDSTDRKLIKAIWDWIAQSAPPSNWSMEQLWLAFVMKIKYDKCWNDKDWVITFAL